MIRLGFLCSSGGAVAGAAVQLLRSQGYSVDVAMVTDRECAAERMASDMGFSFRRIKFSSHQQFSQEAAEWLYDDQGMDWCCLLFLRLVSASLYRRAPCVNLHPSLLPAYRGFGALNAAHLEGARFFGATAHLVDETIDGGPIIAQVRSPLARGMDLPFMQRISYAQKLYLLLILAEMMCQRVPQEAALGLAKLDTTRKLLNPSLSDRGLETAFCNYLAAEGIPWTMQ